MHACTQFYIQWNLGYPELVYPVPQLSGHAQLRLICMRRGRDRWLFGGVATVDQGAWKLKKLIWARTDWPVWTLLTMIVLYYRYRLKTRHHISGEKTKHFSYPDYFTCPVCQHQGCGQRGPDNRGCTVLGWTMNMNVLDSKPMQVWCI